MVLAFMGTPISSQRAWKVDLMSVTRRLASAARKVALLVARIGARNVSSRWRKPSGLF